MKIIDVEQGTDEWKQERLGKISGTRLGDIWAARSYTKKDMVEVLDEIGASFKRSLTIAELETILPDEAREKLLERSPRKIGFYETIAERLALPRDYSESAMDRGTRLEPVARNLYQEITGKTVDEVGICVSEAHPNIINSPDGLIKNADGKYTEALEIKCLNPARHIQAVVEDAIPDEYWTQKLQYFVVNEDLQTLYWMFYNPDLATVPVHIVEVHREDLGDWPERLKEFQLIQLKQIEQIIEKLAF